MTRHSISALELRDAVRRGKARTASEFRATSVHYRLDADAIEITTTDGAGFLVPRLWIAPLASMSPQDLSDLEVWPGGAAFEVRGRDVQVSIHGLLMSVLPKLISAKILAALFARKGGAVTSAAKQASARENGAKGGRPRKAVHA